MATLFGSFDAKEVGLGGQIRSSQNEKPTWPLSPNNSFEYKTKKKNTI